MTLACLAFTTKGKALADRLAAALGGSSMRCGQPLSLAAWTAKQFRAADGLIFVGAAGIAVRAIAPHIRHKTVDPAVVVVDECGRFAIPILSGHLGGANDLARAAAMVCGATPVLTTATDANGVFAVDEWARRQNCALLDPDAIKRVSSCLLEGGTIRVRSAWLITGKAPAGVLQTADSADVCLELFRGGDGLRLVPRIVVLGVGCKRGTPQAAIEAALTALLEETGLHEAAICTAATIDRKLDEPGLLAFCQAHGWPLTAFSAQQLHQAAGDFTPSDFVREVTGVDNVCERAAVLAAGDGGSLLQKKRAGGGVTMALARKPFEPTWRWRDE